MRIPPLFPAAILAIAVAVPLGACSRNQQPVAEAVKPMQQTMDKAKAVDQTLQQGQEKREKEMEKSGQ